MARHVRELRNVIGLDCSMQHYSFGSTLLPAGCFSAGNLMVGGKRVRWQPSSLSLHTVCFYFLIRCTLRVRRRSCVFSISPH